MLGRLDLPMLPSVLDHRGVDERLRGLLSAHAGGHEVPPLDSVSLIAVRPGRRALLAYDLGGGRVRLLGKHFRDVGQARRVYATMAHLWSETFAGQGRLGVPRPLGVLPELSMVVYVPVEGRALGDLLTHAGAEAAVRQTARWLAHLHGSHPALDRRLDLAHEVENAGTWARDVAGRFPEHAGTAERIIDRLRDLAPELDLTLDVAIHKDLHHDHVIVRRRRLSVIDFDEMRYGDPAVDLAHFCAYLRLDGLRTNSSREQLERAFLDEYARRTGWENGAGLEFFFAYTCLKIARQLVERRAVGVRPKEKGRRRLLHGILAEAQAGEAVYDRAREGTG